MTRLVFFRGWILISDKQHCPFHEEVSTNMFFCGDYYTSYHSVKDYLCVKLVITQVKWCVDWFERLKVYVHFLLFAVICYNCSTINHKAIGRNCYDKYTAKHNKQQIRHLQVLCSVLLLMMYCKLRIPCVLNIRKILRCRYFFMGSYIVPPTAYQGTYFPLHLCQFWHDTDSVDWYLKTNFHICGS